MNWQYGVNKELNPLSLMLLALAYQRDLNALSELVGSVEISSSVCMNASLVFERKNAE